MLGRRRLRRKLLRWSIFLVALGTLYVAAIDDKFNLSGKAEANRIASPWDSCNAPQPYVNKQEIKVKPLLYKPSPALKDNDESRQSRKHRSHRHHSR